MKCIKKDDNTCIVIGTDVPLEIECSDPDLFISLFNSEKESSNLNLFNDNKQNYEIIKDFKNELQISYKKEHDSEYIYINSERTLSSEEKNILSSSNGILHITNCSINYIIKIFHNAKYLKHVFIIELFDDVLITMVNQNDKDSNCLSCLLNRYLESREDIFKFKNIKSLITNTLTSEELVISSKLLARSKITNNDNQITIINKRNLEIKNSDLVSMNNCSSCFNNQNKMLNVIEWLNKVDKKENRNYRIKNIEDAVSILHKYVTPLGPIYNLKQSENLDFLDVFAFEATSNSTEMEIGYNLHGGKGSNQSVAMISTIGESLERYNARKFNNESLIRGTYNELKRLYSILNPCDLILDNSSPYKFNPDKIYDWAICRNITKNKDILVPAISILFPFYTMDESELFLSQSSTGLASGFASEEAILHGLFEIIERDAYTIYHKNSMYYGTIDRNIYSKEVIDLVNYLSDNDIETILHYLKTDVAAHTVHCTLLDKNKRQPIYTHGSSCSLDINTSIKNAIVEACQLRISQINLLKSDDFIGDEFISYLEWAKGNKKFVFPFIKHKNKKIISNFQDFRKGDIIKNLNHLLKNINDLGYDVIVANLSRVDNPLYTFRVLIPGFQDIDDCGGRESKRLKEIPELVNIPINRNFFPIFS